MIYYPANNESANMMRAEIQDCIETYYPELSVEQVDIAYMGNEISFEVFYKIVNTNTLNKVSLLFIKSGQYLV